MFIEMPASNMSISKRRLICGVGINDSCYIVKPIINGKQFRCPYYSRWENMLVRCYSNKFKSRCPTYVGCSVLDEWLVFSNFKVWMEKQDWKGKHLDKDILIQGNKIYSPETCLFVSCKINLLLINHKARRGNHPQGVCFNKTTKKYRAGVRVDGVLRFLGVFDTSELAYNAYKAAKYNIIKGVALGQSEPLRSALLNYEIKE